jgi:hydrogenase maturation factor
MSSSLPLGKLPPRLLAQLLAQAPISDPRVLLKPGIGLDCAVIDLGDTLLVFKSDPITFATDEIGWYLVQVNSNDIATTGATPRWLMVTMLLPEGKTTPDLVMQINQQLVAACQEKGIMPQRVPRASISSAPGASSPRCCPIGSCASGRSASPRA